MGTPTEWKVDKSRFPPGPWMNEPDRVEWRRGNLILLAVRQKSHGAWCGYVGVPPGHPWHGKKYSAEGVRAADVHGGLTYSDACHGPVCHVPAPGEPDSVWWLGFDCVHAGDYAPGHDLEHRGPYGGFPGDSYRTQGFVQLEIERLADQAERAAA